LVIFEIWKKKYIHADNKNAAGQQNQAAQEAIKLSPEQEKERLLALCTVFLIVIFFWMSFHQNGFALTLFAQRSTIDENKITGGNIKDWSEFKKEVMSDSLPLTEEFAAMAPAEQLSERELNSLNKVLFVPDLFFINQQRQVKLPYEDKPNTEILRKMSILGLFSMTIQDQEKIGLKKAVHEVDALISVDRDSLSKADLRTFRIVNRKLLAQRYSQIDEGYYPLKPETYATFNPFFILLLTPLVVGLFNWLRKRSKEPSSPAKMGIGMFLSGIAMMIMAIACLSGGNADANNLSPSWLISSYFVITIGELFLSPMGLSFVSKVAPARMRGLMMGGWFGATAVGNYLSGFIGQFYSTLEHHEFFIILVVLLFLSALMIRLTLKKLKHATRGT
ncbi:hypothetical protein JXJ21_10285, partial [candidate division KSB1 bacterium]|nr:hypothetical protein [candidate division KSB1 bacterium]